MFQHSWMEMFWNFMFDSILFYLDFCYPCIMGPSRVESLGSSHQHKWPPIIVTNIDVVVAPFWEKNRVKILPPWSLNYRHGKWTKFQVRVETFFTNFLKGSIWSLVKMRKSLSVNIFFFWHFIIFVVTQINQKWQISYIRVQKINWLENVTFPKSPVR